MELGKEFEDLFNEPKPDPIEEEAKNTGMNIALGLSSLTVFHGYAAEITLLTGSPLPVLIAKSLSVALALKNSSGFLKAVRELQKKNAKPQPPKPN